MHVHIYPGKLMVTYQHTTNLMDSPRTRFYVNHSEVVTWTWSHWSHSSVMGSLVNVWTSAEAIGTSPQLRDDIHRVLSRANDAFEDQKTIWLDQKQPLTWCGVAAGCITWHHGWQVQAKFLQNWVNQHCTAETIVYSCLFCPSTVWMLQ